MGRFPGLHRSQLLLAVRRSLHDDRIPAEGGGEVQWPNAAGLEHFLGFSDRCKRLLDPQVGCYRPDRALFLADTSTDIPMVRSRLIGGNAHASPPVFYVAVFFSRFCSYKIVANLTLGSGTLIFLHFMLYRRWKSS